MAQLALAVSLIAVGVGALLVLAQVWHRGLLWRRPALSGMAAAAAVYAFGHALEIAGRDAEWVVGTYAIQYAGIAAAPSLLLWLASRYDRRRWLAGRVWRVVAVAVPLATWLVVATEPWHDWFHVDVALVARGPFTVVSFERGPAYWGFQAYAAAAVLLANVVLLDAWRAGRGVARAQARLLFLASVVPWLGNLVHLLELSPVPVDTMALALPVTSFLLYRGVVGHGLAEIGPIARDQLVQHLGDAALVVDRDGRILDANDAAHRLLGTRPDRRDDALGLRLAEALPELAPFASVQAAGEEPSSDQIEVAGRSYHVRREPVGGDPGAAVAVALLLRDVTRYVELETRLRALATTDELTGIANRRHFLDLAEREVARARRHDRHLGLIVFDLDGFKGVNDTHGHLAGDAVLRAIAALAAAEVRATDVVGRLGGDEFAVCLPEADGGEVARVGERLRAAIAAHEVGVVRAVVRVRASVGGCTRAPGESVSLVDMLARADAAAYRAKAGGGDTVVIETAPDPT